MLISIWSCLHFIILNALAGYFVADLLNDFLEQQTENSTIMEEKGPEDSRDITYFIRLRAFDERNNTGVWSNIISASFLKPEAFVDPVSLRE